jgi:thiamine transport system ATP-binding protein
MFQDHTLFPHRDAAGNVAFGPRMHGASRADAAEQARAMLALVGLSGYEHRRVAELSGGEQQRVALARALAPEPALLMLDEPLGALDRHLRERLVDDLGRLFRELHQSVLVVTHDHDEAFGLADRVAILHRGHIEQVGPPTELWRRPETRFVAEFLGWNVVALDGQDAGRVAIRPDAVRLDDGGDRSGVVHSRTFRRDHWRVRVRLDQDDQTVELVVRDREPPSAGDRVRLAIDAASTSRSPLTGTRGWRRANGSAPTSSCSTSCCRASTASRSADASNATARCRS